MASRAIRAHRGEGFMYLVFGGVVFILFAAAFRYYLPGIASGAVRRMAFVHVHAAIMMGWSVLFLVQASLVRMRKVSLHRAIGRFGIGFTILFVVDAVGTSLVATRLGGDHIFAPPPVFLAFVLLITLQFAIFAGIGLVWRRRLDWHRRMMLAAFISLVPVALTRLPVFGLTPPGMMLTTDGLLIGAAIYDGIRSTRVHPAFITALGIEIGIQLLTFALLVSPPWSALVMRLAA